MPVRKNKKQKTKKTELASGKVEYSFKKHLMPPLMGLFVGLLVIGVLNSHIIAAKIHSLTYKPPVQVEQKDEQLSQEPEIDVNAPAKIKINDISVDAPVIYNDKLRSETEFQLALRDGVVHYPDTAKPGEDGNVVIFGHSSGQVWAPGNYKFVFTHLEKLENGDNIFLEYQGKRFTYQVSDKKVVQPNDVSVLYPTPTKTLTLITCTPVGTNKNRLIITADQISPEPESENKNQSSTGITEIQQLPGTVNPSFWDSIKEMFN